MSMKVQAARLLPIFSGSDMLPPLISVRLQEYPLHVETIWFKEEANCFEAPCSPPDAPGQVKTSPSNSKSYASWNATTAFAT